MEALKIIGGLCWGVGLLALFVEPLVGIIVLIVALVLSIRSATMTRERRHQELLQATRQQNPPPPEG